MDFDLLPDVVIFNLIQFTKTDDLCRMKRYSSRFMELVKNELARRENKKTYYLAVDGHQSIVPDKSAKPWIHFNFLTMERFLEKRPSLQPTKFHFKFPRDEYIFAHYGDWEMTRFLGLHGARITHLYLSELKLPLVMQREIDFFRTVSTSLTHLTIDRLSFRRRRISQQVELPAFLGNLVMLKIGHLFVDESDDERELDYFWSVVQACNNLETFHFPPTQIFMPAFEVYRGDSSDEESEDDEGFLSDEDDEVIPLSMLNFTRVHRLLVEGHLTRLQTYDLQKLDWRDAEEIDNVDFVEMCTILGHRNVKLTEVDFQCFENVANQRILSRIEAVISSMVNYRLNLGGRTTFPNMEKITLKTWQCKTGTLNPDIQIVAPVWPALRDLTLEINSNFLGDIGQTNDLCQNLFEGERRPSIEILKLASSRPGYALQWNLPRLEVISNCCINVTTLTMNNWNATDTEYAAMFGNLQHLTSLTLENCQSLGIAAFTGGDAANPISPRLTNLKTLRLLQVQLMPNINTEVFKKVFRNMALTDFVICSFEDMMRDIVVGITSFGEDAINELKDSAFAESIEYFPYDCWTLLGYERHQMKELLSQFRSKNMN